MNVEVTSLRSHPVPEGEGLRTSTEGESYTTTLTKARALSDLGYVKFDEPKDASPPSKPDADKA